MKNHHWYLGKVSIAHHLAKWIAALCVCLGTHFAIMTSYSQHVEIKPSWEAGHLAKVEILVDASFRLRDEVALLKQSDNLGEPWRIAGSKGFDVRGEVRFDITVDPGSQAQFFEVVHQNGVLRTPDFRFENLEGFPFEVDYAHVGEDLHRLGYIDSGVGDPIVLLSDEFTGIYAFKDILSPIVESGRRVIAIDLPGVGFSDKPVDPLSYSLENVQALVDELIFDVLDLQSPVLAGYAWSTLIVSRIGVDRKDAIKGLVYLGGGHLDGSVVPQGLVGLSRDIAGMTFPGLMNGAISFAMQRTLTDGEREGLHAAYPDSRYTVGTHGLWSMMPISADHPSALSMQSYTDELLAFEKPVLIFSSPYWDFNGVDRLYDIEGAKSHDNHYDYNLGGWYPLEYPQDVVEGLIWTGTW